MQRYGYLGEAQYVTTSKNNLMERAFVLPFDLFNNCGGRAGALSPLTTGAHCPPWPVIAPRDPVQAPLITGHTGCPLGTENMAVLTSDLRGDPGLPPPGRWTRRQASPAIRGSANRKTAPCAPQRPGQHRAPHRGPASSERPTQPWPNRVAEA